MRLLASLHASSSNITLEISARKANCQRCRQIIPGNHQRINFSAPLANPYTAKHGGSVYRLERLFHPECFFEIFNLDINVPPKRCWDCADTISGRIQNFAWIRHQNTYWSQALCTDCAKSGRWRWCSLCKQYVGRFRASPIIEEGIVTSQFLCDSCQNEAGILTVKKQKRIKKGLS